LVVGLNVRSDERLA